MIKSFSDKETAALYDTDHSKIFSAFGRIALRKLDMLHAAVNLDSLRVPPSNRLEALKGDRQGEHSIRINDQWLICFRWEGHDSYDVEIIDYH